MKNEVGFYAKTDGAFFISLEDYHARFGNTFINYDTTKWSRDSFLMLSDTTSTPGQHRYCGENCVRHKFTLTSTVKQKVKVSASVWQKREYPTADGCRDGAIKGKGKRKHVLFV